MTPIAVVLLAPVLALAFDWSIHVHIQIACAAVWGREETQYKPSRVRLALLAAWTTALVLVALQFATGEYVLAGAIVLGLIYVTVASIESFRSQSVNR